MNIRKIAVPVLLFLLLSVLAVEVPRAIASRDRDYDWYTPVIDVRTLLDDRYVREVDGDVMQQAAIAAMVDSLDDPHTVYVPPVERDVFEKELSGRYSGIGAEIRQVDDRLKIITPLDDSPSLAAGLRAGDIVMSIDGTDTLGLGAQGCIDLLLGEPGTDVVLHITRPDGTEGEVVVTRAPIAARTVEGLLRRDGTWRHWIDESAGLAFLEIDQFTESTVNEVAAVLDGHAAQLKGLIIDVRGNPGGALPAAVGTADLFVADGALVHIRPDRADRAGESRTYDARAGHVGEGVPVVVLVDQHSASASEILAGALQQGSDARILGERTFGKGSVQELRPLGQDLGLVKFTTAHYALPDGRILQRRSDDPLADWGVDPSTGCVVAEDESQRIDRIRAREPWRVIPAEEPALDVATDARWMRDTLKDAALAEATELLQMRVADGAWPELGEDDDLAFTPASEDLASAQDARAMLLDRLELVEREIARLTDAGIDAPAGFESLDEEAHVGELEITLRDADGNALGTWRAVHPEATRSALHQSRLERVEAP